MITDEENVEVYASSVPEFDPNDLHDQMVLREQMPNMDGKRMMFDQENMSLEERRNELWTAFEEQPKIMNVMSINYAPYHNDLD